MGLYSHADVTPNLEAVGFMPADVTPNLQTAEINHAYVMLNLQTLGFLHADLTSNPQKVRSDVSKHAPQCSSNFQACGQTPVVSHSNETCSAVVLQGTICFSAFYKIHLEFFLNCDFCCS